MLVFCRVREADGDTKGKRFYVHEVFTEDEINKGLPSQTGTAKEGKKSGGKPLYKSILQQIMSVNKDEISKVVDENGEPLVVYHGTNIGFDSFENTTYGTLGAGNYFFVNKKSAENWADYTAKGRQFGEPTVIDAFVNIRNPITLDTELTD